MKGGYRKNSGRKKKKNKKEDLTVTINAAIKKWLKTKPKSASSKIEELAINELAKNGLNIKINGSTIPVKFHLGSILIENNNSGWQKIIEKKDIIRFYPIGSIYKDEDEEYIVKCHLNFTCNCDRCQDAETLEDFNYYI